MHIRECALTGPAPPSKNFDTDYNAYGNGVSPDFASHCQSALEWPLTDWRPSITPEAKLFDRYCSQSVPRFDEQRAPETSPRPVISTPSNPADFIPPSSSDPDIAMPLQEKDERPCATTYTTTLQSLDGPDSPATPTLNVRDDNAVVWRDADPSHPWNWKRSRKWKAISIGAYHTTVF
jgi:hypothetical protein